MALVTEKPKIKELMGLVPSEVLDSSFQEETAESSGRKECCVPSVLSCFLREPIPSEKVEPFWLSSLLKAALRQTLALGD